ncbi:MAG: ATP-binding protein [Bacteroidota bacterium]
MIRYLWLACLLLLVTPIKSENIDSLRVSLGKAATARDSNGYYTACYNLISGLYETDRRDEALIEAQKAIAYFNKEKDKTHKVNLLVLVAEKSRLFGHYDAALKYFAEAAHCGDISDMDNMESYIFSRMAAVYFEQNKYQLTDAYIDSSQRVLKPGRNEHILISNLEILGASQRAQGHYQKAIDYFRKALNKIPDESFISMEANLYNNLAKTYLAMQDFPNALSYSLKANEASVKIHSKILLESAAECLAKAYAGTGHYKLAYQYLEIKENLKWQRYAEARDRLIADMNAQYESGKKEARIAEQTYLIGQEKRENNFLITGIILVVLILGYVFFTQWKLKKVNRLLFLKNEETNRQSNDLEIQNQELHKLSDFKETITGMVIHDLKNPLNTMINLEHVEKNPEKAMLIIEKNGRVMLNMVMNILDVYKYENTSLIIKAEAANINKIIREACNDVRLLATEKDLHINIIANAGFTILADSELVQRVFSNLLANAIKFSKSGDSIDITFTEAEHGWLKVEITDKGDGIDPTILPVIFDKFAQAAKKKSGLAGSTGLGLAFCKMVVEAHGGKIGVTSEQGAGSVFWFTLPFINNPESIDLPAKNLYIPIIIEKLQLNSTTLRELAPYLVKLRKLEIYAVSEIHDCLKTIPASKDAYIQRWKDEVYQAVYTMNGTYYHSLINQ